METGIQAQNIVTLHELHERCTRMRHEHGMSACAVSLSDNNEDTILTWIDPIVGTVEHN